MERADRAVALAEGCPEAILSVDEQGFLVEWSPGAERLFGYTRAEALGRHASFFAPVERKEEISHAVVRIARGESVRMQTARVRKDGALVDVELSLSGVRDPSGAMRGMWGVARDLTELRRLERHVAYLERSFAVLQGIADAALHAREPAALHREVCRIAVERGGLLMAWVGRVDPRTAYVTPLAHHGHEDGYLLQTSITAKDAPRGRGPTGRAIRELRPVVSSDIEHDPSFLPWRDAALARGYRSAAAIPVVVGEAVVATINFYAPETDFFTPSTIRLLTSIADILSIAEERAAVAQRRAGP